MAIYTKRWNDPVEPSDGRRILISRYRPRGLSKANETWSEWLPNLGPSVELHAAAYSKNHVPITWETYRARYLREMRAQREVIAKLAQDVSRGETITLLCSSACERESRCHRSLLRDLIAKHLASAEVADQPM